MAKYAVNYNGLRKRDTYEQAIDYLHFHQENIINPNRRALNIRNSFLWENMINTSLVAMQEQQLKQMQDHDKFFKKNINFNFNNYDTGIQASFS
jgi:hypothetical protein